MRRGDGDGDQSLPSFRSRRPRGRGGDNHQALPGRVILAGLIALGVACVAGYFFLMKMVDISRQEDCFMAGGRNCGQVQSPYKF
jgi:hypothetical protein